LKNYIDFRALFMFNIKMIKKKTFLYFSYESGILSQDFANIFAHKHLSVFNFTLEF